MRYFLTPLFLITFKAFTLGQAGGIINSGYHDLTAHYNGYFIAREKIQKLNPEFLININGTIIEHYLSSHPLIQLIQNHLRLIYWTA